MRLLLAGGGAFKGAYQVPILTHLWRTRGPYDAVIGTSVGAINLSMIAQDSAAALLGIWRALNDRDPTFGIKGFMRPAWWRLLESDGLYSLAPMRAMLEQHVNPDRLRCPLVCGVVARSTGEHRLLKFDSRSRTKDLHDGIVASSSMSGIHVPLRIGGEDLVDGGHHHVVGPIPQEWMGAVREVDAVFCQELEPPSAAPDGLVGAFGWALDTAMRLTALEDLEDLAEIARTGVRVRVWSPGVPLGGMLDASRETISRRLALGMADIDRQMVLPTPSGRESVVRPPTIRRVP
jgi:predicted acylesterase/phospholipase RssA